MAEKLSAAELTALLQGIQRELTQQRRPAAFRIYKPTKSGAGFALSLQLRLDPVYDEEKGYLKETNGGVFLELAKQTGTTDDGFASFAWKEAATSKLGIPDFQAILTAIQCRRTGSELPTSLQKKQPQGKEPNAWHLGLYHKNPKGGSTAIDYEIVDQGAYLAVSAQRDEKETSRGRIGISIPEELALEQFLQHALRQAIIWGL
jgi:hypothetical protein